MPWGAPLPLALPLGLLLAGALIGLPFTLNPVVATERVVGLLLAAALGIAATLGLRRLPDRAVPATLLALAVAALLGGVGIIAADAQVFRGTLGGILDGVFAPIRGRAALGDHVSLINTRYIVGYNGLADLCLVSLFASAGVLLARRRRVEVALAALVLIYSLALLLGTGSRGGLAGLLAGVWLAGIVLWRRGWLLTLATTPLAAVVAAFVLPKGLETSSTEGRFTFWADIGRLLWEFPLTGVGLGIDTAEHVIRAYEINPDRDRIAYAHNTFVQTYLEQGPLGALGMLLLPALAVLAAILTARQPLSVARRAMLLAGLGTLAGLEVHGLTDQVLTTNGGTALLLLAVALVLAVSTPGVERQLNAWSARAALAIGASLLLVAGSVLLVPPLRAQAMLNLGGLFLSRATLPPGRAVDLDGVATAEAFLQRGLASEPRHPAVWRSLARARLVRYDIAGAEQALQTAAASPRLDAFDALQIAQVYRGLGQTTQAYAWAANAFDVWGRTPPAEVLRDYSRALLPDDQRVRVLAEQGEAALRGHEYHEALDKFRQALALAPEPKSPYLLDRLSAAERGLQRQQQQQQLGNGRQTP